ncbi:MAG TPA: dihydropteroate synthase [Bacteroidales bacterium]|nr:dihydropteroate synthase [Bacteroidales bacterium]HSA43797.1 dihydropteroate synthase [Bacteroidales bacterium]
MGILNLSPESFYYPGSNPDTTDADSLTAWVEGIRAYIDILDIGAVSTRPGSRPVPEEEEIRRLGHALAVLVPVFPDLPVSVDTFRASAAGMALEAGAVMVNDISGGSMDSELHEVVAGGKVPYVLSHIRGTPENMQKDPVYGDVVKEIILYFAEGIEKLTRKGIGDIILDPGFGFGKTVEHNYELLSRLEEFQVLGRPLMVGLSRKSMIQKVLNCEATACLNGTTVLNTIALMKGADILRVHDPKEAREAVILHEKTNSA